LNGTLSGTQTILNLTEAGTTSVSQGQYGAVWNYQYGSTSWQAGYDYIIPVGSAMQVLLPQVTGAVIAAVYFEEVLLPLSF
jgi:hypothetical protein